MRRRLPSLMSIALICALVGVLFAGTATARRRGGPDPGMEPTASERAVQAARQEIAALELFTALGLDAAQQTALAELIGDTVAEREAHRAERQAVAPELEGILQGYLAELKKDGAPSDATVAALAEFREANRPDRSARKEGRKDAREQLEAILSDDQLETLREFRPMAAAGPSPSEQVERRERRDARERGHARQTVKNVLMSPAFLALLD